MKNKEEIEERLRVAKDVLADPDLCDHGSPITERVIAEVLTLQWVLED